MAVSGSGILNLIKQEQGTQRQRAELGEYSLGEREWRSGFGWNRGIPGPRPGLQGTYRVLWGGSAVHSPLLEIGLGDLDGDGIEELAAIESPVRDAGRYLTLWRWHGWGFSLVWRSMPGNYRDLIILPPMDGQPARLSVAVSP